MYDVIRREEPDRWRRHVVRRHVVSEKPTPEFEIDDVDKEAPTDEWGFPAVAGKLSQSGGACASDWEAGQHISPAGNRKGLIRELMTVDVVEAYSPPRVTLEAKKFGLEPGEAWDLTNGWDFNRKDHQEKAESYLD